MAGAGFDPDKYLQEKSASISASQGFDPDVYLQQKGVAVESKPQTSTGQTALEHFGNGAAFGYLPQLQAVAEKGVDAISSAKDKVLQTIGLDELASIDAQLRQKGFKLPEKTYTEVRDENVKRLAQEKKDHPNVALASELAGGVATGIATGGLMPEVGAAETIAGKIAQGAWHGAKTGAVYGAASNPGDVEGEISPLQFGERYENAKRGAKYGTLIGAAVPVVAKAIESGSDAVSNTAGKLKKLAEKSAVNATGATGKEATKFSDNAGRELLDRGIVKFGDSQEKIAGRASAAVEEANKQIDTALSDLENKGVKVDANKIYDSVRKKITELKADPSKADISGILEKELDNLVNATEAKGTTQFGVKEAEEIKRGYGRKAGNWADPEKSMAGKEMYQTYRKGVEDAATAKAPETAKLFEQGKKSYGLLAPIQEAAERRASTTAQSPAGGLADISAALAGFLKGGYVGAVTAAIGRRLVAPRIASSIAITADSAADMLRKIPQLAEVEVKQPAAFQAIVNDFVKSKNVSASPVKAAEEEPTKGPSKWANDGLKKLEEHGSKKLDKGALLDNPKAKKLLIAASDLKPGSRAMAKILEELNGLEEK